VEAASLVNMVVINVAKQFTRYPAGRYARLGETSGEGFRLKHLAPAALSGKPFTVELDGTVGYGSSFLEEAFGGLVRQLHVNPDALLKQMTLMSQDRSLIAEIEQYIRDAASVAEKR
jgi:hypothetical protein